MCGIFGVVSQTAVSLSTFSQLAAANKHRGNLAFGYMTGMMEAEGVQTAVYRHLDQGLPIAQAIQSTIEQLDGQQACWLWHEAETAVYLWRVMSPIYVAHTDEMFAFSSSQTDTIHTLLPEGVVMRFDTRRFTFSEIITFSFYSPYMQKRKGISKERTH